MRRFEHLRAQNLGRRRPATPPDVAPQNVDELEGLDDLVIPRPIQLLLSIGIDGQGPLASAAELADAARTSSRTTDEAVSSVSRATIVRGSAGGFATGVGGFWALPVALPVNVVEFYVQAARMVAAIAILRGYDVDDPPVRKSVLQALVGTQQDSPLVTAASGTRGAALTWRVLHVLPAGVRLLAGKGIGFRLLRAMTELLLGRFGRGVPFLGGIVVAAVDGWNLRRIAEHAKVAFPAEEPMTTGEPPAGGSDLPKS